MITLDDVAIECKPSETDKHWVKYSQYGYMITKDGTVYSLLHYATHGLVLSLLQPEEYKAWYTKVSTDVTTEPMLRSSVPEALWPETIDEVNKYFYQDFEMSVGNNLPVIRIAGFRMTGSPSVDKGCGAVTSEQIASVRHVFKACGFDRTTIVETNRREMPVDKMWEFLASDEMDPYSVELPKVEGRDEDDYATW